MVSILDDRPKYDRDTLVASLVEHESKHNGTHCSCGWVGGNESDIYSDHLADVYEIAVQSPDGG